MNESLTQAVTQWWDLNSKKIERGLTLYSAWVGTTKIAGIKCGTVSRSFRCTLMLANDLPWSSTHSWFPEVKFLMVLVSFWLFVYYKQQQTVNKTRPHVWISSSISSPLFNSRRKNITFILVCDLKWKNLYLKSLHEIRGNFFLRVKYPFSLQFSSFVLYFNITHLQRCASKS